MAVRDGGPQSPPAPTASMLSSEIGGSAGLVDEDEFRGIKIELGGEPAPASQAGGGGGRVGRAVAQCGRQAFRCEHRKRGALVTRYTTKGQISPSPSGGDRRLSKSGRVRIGKAGSEHQSLIEVTRLQLDELKDDVAVAFALPRTSLSGGRRRPFDPDQLKAMLPSKARSVSCGNTGCYCSSGGFTVRNCRSSSRS